ncbi:hypothetical protein CCAND38_540022 [Capnocytophaga canis]|uniref:Uncharacterized protein n=1 Tax=Capnocytophaga canis TaxID=1848903 RepID=A0A0B7IDP9_9FLAO|nr:hypothetical protein CCAND38_540022 [Capnocytophaga canis]
MELLKGSRVQGLKLITLLAIGCCLLLLKYLIVTIFCSSEIS